MLNAKFMGSLSTTNTLQNQFSDICTSFASIVLETKHSLYMKALSLPNSPHEYVKYYSSSIYCGALFDDLYPYNLSGSSNNNFNLLHECGAVY